MHTNAMIHVKDKGGKTVRKLTNQEFNDHKLEDGQSYDFHEFRSSDKFANESKPMQKTIENLKRIHQKNKLNLSPNSRIIMNTARADFDDKHKFLSAFKKHGIDIDDIHVHRAGNIPGSDLPAKKKLVYIRKHLDDGNYKEVHMYDDSKTNLDHFNSLRSEYPHVRFHAWHVDHQGNIRPHK
jgi:hypothetical protein